MNFIVRCESLLEEILFLHDKGLPAGSSTGWPTVDEHYTVGMNQWTLVTGIPHSGKSEWLDALMVNLAKGEPWKFLIFSPENHPLSMHVAKILEKVVGKPFGRGPTERMTSDEVKKGLDWMSDKFFFLRLEEPSLPSIVEHAAWAVPVDGFSHKAGIVVDPWNTLEHRHPKDMTLTQYVSEQLSWIVNFTRTYPVHFWLVAHPRKLDKDRSGKPPTPYDIADSAHFYNKADNIITVHRNQLEQNQKVEIHVQKVRFKNIGHIGVVELMYDKVTGRYFEKVVDHAIAHYYER